jgi:2,3-bisphosphoglycerate-independent phosphoglycerate mutase
VRLGEEVAKAGKKQYRIAETEKYAHVTYFFNGGLEKPLEGEEREIIPSKKVATYDQAPEMSAQEITDKLLAALEKQEYEFILVNYANPDMVGHTGDYDAGIKAVEETDRCLGILIKAVLAQGGSLLITADHGNVEEMVNLKTGERDTEHSTNPVPCWLVSPDNHRPEPMEMPMAQIQGMIVDVPPTVLNLMDLEQPPEMSGASLLGILV